jgi:hypothetical protein
VAARRPGPENGFGHVIARVLVAVDAPEDLALIDRACAIAAEHRATLEIVGGIPSTAFTVSFVTCPKALNSELEAFSCDLVADAVARVPRDVPLRWRHVRGCARSRLLSAAGRDDTQLLVVRRLPWWARGALRRRLSRRVLVPDLGVTSPAAQGGGSARRRAGTLA